MIQSSSAAHAKAYFSQNLEKADYYINDQELNGQIQGKLAERLGLEGAASKEVFFALCENTDPLTGQPLTPRTKEQRTTGYDINFHCPKSVSIIHALSKDDHIIKAFENAVRVTMQDIESDALTRIRKEGQYDDRATGELVWADFIHQTARPVEGHTPDPHLHAHCFVFNATWDEQEQQIKAVQFRDIKRDMPYYQARFHKRLSDRLIDLGYGIKRTDQSFEIENVPEQVIGLFSKRTDEIGRVAKEKGITDAKELSELGARTRSKKQAGLSMDELKSDWKRQIHELPQKESEGKSIIRNAPVQDRKMMNPSHCLDHAMEHGFERASVIRDRRLLESAYRHSIGARRITLDHITDLVAKDERLITIQEKGQTMMTTRSVLSEEQHMVKLAREGVGKLIPLYRQSPALELSGQQHEAVSHVLTTTNRVSIIRGAAGSGKTTLMKEAVRHIESSGKKVTVVAPTSEASRGVLKSEGFENADTVARLLVDKKMQDKLKDQVLWVDEAGLLGTKDMTALLEIAKTQDARLILGGDTRQHSSVVRGDALRILNTVAGIQSAEVSRIYRQRNEDYRAAVEDLSKGNVSSAFEKLESMQAIKTVDPENPNQGLVSDYITTLKRGKTALVISPTHKQSEEVSAQIREQLKESRIIGKREITATKLSSLNLTTAEKEDWRNFRKDHVICFHQNIPGADRGSKWTVHESNENDITLLDKNGETLLLPRGKAESFDVYAAKEIALAKGDQIRLTRNGFDKSDKRMNNGQIFQVQKARKGGTIDLVNTVSQQYYRIDKDFGHLDHAYCITSHASQGKTVDEVFIAQPAATFPATDSKQLYVSVSRGRDKVHIYTDDKEELLTHASRMGDRQSAIELVGKHSIARDIARQQSIEQTRQTCPIEKPRSIEKTKSLKDRDYEPGI